MRKTDRLDVPGFSFGEKTGEYIDVPKIFGGKPSSKKSRQPNSLPELMAARSVSRKRKAALFAAEASREQHSKNKRIRTRKAHKAITNDKPVAACNRRFFEFMGLRADFLAYNEEPELFVSKAKTAYEITDGFLPILTTTSAREALIICRSLAAYGIAVYFNLIKVPS